MSEATKVSMYEFYTDHVGNVMPSSSVVFDSAGNAWNSAAMDVPVTPVKCDSHAASDATTWTAAVDAAIDLLHNTTSDPSNQQ